jgi:hypothetical protein
MKKRIIPFGWLPGSWGLRGKTRERAEAEYYFDGHELDSKLVDIDHEKGTKEHAMAKAKVDFKHKKTDAFEHDKRVIEIEYAGDQKALALELARVHNKHGKLSDYDFAITSAEILLTGDELAIRKLDINLAADKISEYEYAIAKAEITLEGDELALRKLEVDFEYGKIEKIPYEKAVANIKKEPYVAVINSDYNPAEGAEGLFFEFDWNDLWISLLQSHGFNGLTEEEIVKQWFEELCRSVIHENMQSDTVPFNSGRIINQVRHQNGRSDFS